LTLKEQTKIEDWGLVSMQERVHLVDGIFLIESKVGSGTRILARVPWVVETAGME
jgi:signal transduction histidine kinase